jgi:hypothetical protein
MISKVKNVFCFLFGVENEEKNSFITEIFSL